jgi:hypothetical protein
MAAVLFLLVGLVFGVAFCALVVLLLAKAWPRHWRSALIYFGLGDDPEAEAVEDAGRELRQRSLRQAAEGESFAWPASH